MLDRQCCSHQACVFSAHHGRVRRCVLVRVHRCLIQYRFGAPGCDRAISSTSYVNLRTGRPSVVRHALSSKKNSRRISAQLRWIHVKRVEPGATSGAGGAIRGCESPFADRRCQRLGRDQDKGHSKDHFGHVTFGTRRGDCG